MTDHKTPHLKTGDVIAFSGNTRVADTINILSTGIPRWSISHVGVIATGADFSYDDPQTGCNDPVLYEALMKPGKRPCQIQRKRMAGFQAQLLTPYLREDHGKIWHYPLTRPLYEHEQRAAWMFLQAQIGKKYDLDGAIRSGGFIYALVNALLSGRNPDRLNSLFCSESAAGCHNRIGIFPTGNVSRWSPNKWLRRHRLRGTLNKPYRIDRCLCDDPILGGPDPHLTHPRWRRGR